ncbi:MAG: hypothetical protein LUD50_02085 [Clostridia bacterium]|nr:hypothetical protein [Clostridia bacterium]
MKNYFSKKSWASYVMLGVAVLAIIALIFSALSAKNSAAADALQTYAIAKKGAIIAMDVVAIVLALAVFVIDGMFTGKLFSIVLDVARFAVAAFLIASMALMISAMELPMGYIWFSDLEASNQTLITGLNQAVASWALYLVAAIADVVSVSKSLALKKQAPADAAEAA